VKKEVVAGLLHVDEKEIRKELKSIELPHVDGSDMSDGIVRVPYGDMFKKDGEVKKGVSWAPSCCRWC